MKPPQEWRLILFFFLKQIEILDQMMKLKVYRRGKKKYEEQKKNQNQI
jgi:hypothetical protein